MENTYLFQALVDWELLENDRAYLENEYLFDKKIEAFGKLISVRWDNKVWLMDR